SFTLQSSILDSALFFFLMRRRPPRSTLFPYHDALPIYVGFVKVKRVSIVEKGGDGLGSLKPEDTGITKADILEKGFRKTVNRIRSEEHTSELQSRENLVCRLLLEKKKKRQQRRNRIRTE